MNHVEHAPRSLPGAALHSSRRIYIKALFALDASCNYVHCASSFTFACATPRETMVDWIASMVRALTFIGGSPQ